MNIIGDIAGQYKTLEALLKKMPDDTPVSLGDMNDRGPQSIDVIKFFRDNGQAVLGNHEHMMIDAYEGNGFYDLGIWMLNGGLFTLVSCNPDLVSDTRFDKLMTIVRYYNQGHYINQETLSQASHILEELCKENIPADVIEYLKGLPTIIETDDYLLSHAAINPSLPESKLQDLTRFDNIIWNRGTPRRKDKFQFYGHMASRQPKIHRDKQGEFAICLDTSFGKVLTGYSTITKKFYQQDYIID